MEHESKERVAVAQVKVITDSNAFFPDPGVVEELGIEIIPLTVNLGQHSYQEGVNLPEQLFFRRLAQEPERVVVHEPSIEQVTATFRRISETTDRIVCVHISSYLHGASEISQRAAQQFLGRQKIVVLDSATTSVGLGMIVEAAARAAAAGEPQAEVVRIVRNMIPHMYALFLSDTLQFLETWGRLGPAQTLLGTMLGLKPIATMEDGDLLPIEKVREYPHAVDKLYDFIAEFSRIEQMYILQRDFEHEAAQLLERLETLFHNRQFPVIGYPPSLAVHLGPKALGVLVYEGTR